MPRSAPTWAPLLLSLILWLGSSPLLGFEGTVLPAQALQDKILRHLGEYAPTILAFRNQACTTRGTFKDAKFLRTALQHLNRVHVQEPTKVDLREPEEKRTLGENYYYAWLERVSFTGATGLSTVLESTSYFMDGAWDSMTLEQSDFFGPIGNFQRPHFRVFFSHLCELNGAELFQYDSRGRLRRVVEISEEGEKRSEVSPARQALEEIYSSPSQRPHGKSLQEILWQAQRTDRVLVGLVDTGIDYNHPALAYKLWRPPFSETSAIRQQEKDWNDQLFDLVVRSRSLTLAHTDQYIETSLRIDSLKKEVAYRRIRVEQNQKELSDLDEQMKNLRRDMASKKSSIPAAFLKKSLARAAQMRLYSQSQLTELQNKLAVVVQLLAADLQFLADENAQLKSAATLKRDLERDISELSHQMQNFSVGWNFNDFNSKPYDFVLQGPGYGPGNHGTHVGGVIVQGTDDVALVPMTFPKREASGYSDLINYGYSVGARIFNLSLTYSSAEFFSGLNLAILNHPDTLFITSAGNTHTNIEIEKTYPASQRSPNMLVVASADRTGSLSAFSSYSPNLVDLAALGSEILSQVPQGGMGLKSGTSMATPQVTRVAAKMKFINPQLGPEAIIRLLCETADRTTNPHILQFVRCGLLNESAALQAARAFRNH